MARQILRAVVFTIHDGVVLDGDKKAVADFLGSPTHEEKFSRLGYAAEREVLPFLRSITPDGQFIKFYKGRSVLGGGYEECVLAQVTAG